MYLTQLILNPRSRRVQREIAEPYQMHRTVMSAFPTTLAKDERVLFRLDMHPRSGSLNLLVQSQGLPNWSCLDETKSRGYLLQSQEPNPCTKPFHTRFHQDHKLAFRLRANPTVKRNGKRLGLYREREQWDWLNRKAEEAGFQVLSARISRDEQIRGSIYRHEQNHPLRLLAVQFDGLLVVTDPILFERAVQMGIGSGKGFGCGLLSLAPAQ